MHTDMARFVDTISVFDTHEHMLPEAVWRAHPTDILQVLFHHYIRHDLHTAGLRGEAAAKVFPEPPGTPTETLADRWQLLQPYWELCRHTGYGEATRLAAQSVFGIDHLDLAGLERAQLQLGPLQQPGQRLRLLKDLARLDHIQIDDFVFQRPFDAEAPDFFLYDLSWVTLCNGNIDLENLHAASGITVHDLPSLLQAMETIFERHAPCSVAVKSQHAYQRTLNWQERSDADAAAALARILNQPTVRDPALKNCLGDWCWDHGARLAGQYNRPFKIHTGYFAGNGAMPLDFVAPAQLHRLLSKHADTRFVLMHTAWPYTGEILALAKHFPNVYADLCWAWSIDRHRTTDFVRNFIHSVPVNKLFAFGGDTLLPVLAVGFAQQMRLGLTAALEQEIAAGELTEAEAIAFATRVLQTNQQAAFDLAGTRAAIHVHLTKRS